jgi:integrase/recombinase XerD
LFPQRSTPRPLDPSTAQKLSSAAKRRAGSTKVGGIHSLRQAFATQAVEGGRDLAPRQRLLGHDSLTPTMRDVHVAHCHATAQGSPLESLPELLPPR